LIVSQLLTLYTTPIIYLYLDRLRALRHEKTPTAKPQPAATLA
jgi:multidrug efflux pump